VFVCLNHFSNVLLSSNEMDKNDFGILRTILAQLSEQIIAGQDPAQPVPPKIRAKLIIASRRVHDEALFADLIEVFSRPLDNVLVFISSSLKKMATPPGAD